ncbi:MAG TPA: hypothetical protein VG710_18810 [Opitutus sp.]|nr:hypothetical protein [Opitutus sp.]
MSKSNRHAVLAVIAGAWLFAGCAGGPRSWQPQDSTKYTMADTETFVQLDRAVAGVNCTGLQERVLPDGRFEVVANVKNHEDHPLQVETDCVFKDVDGLSVGDDTPFQAFALSSGATEAVRFVSREMKARRYTIRVREAR